MTLLISLFAAIISTIVWYRNAPNGKMELSYLCFMYWGASLMWSVDAAYEYKELGAKFFTPAPLDMLNDAYLGLYVVALGLVIWLAILLCKDPRGVVKASILKDKR